MRYLAMCLLALGLLVSGGIVGAGESARPSGDRIEELLRNWLVDEQGARASLRGYADAALLDFRLIELAPLASGRWLADTQLSFDFGPAPGGIVGHQRYRQGRYRLLLEVRKRELGLIRFTPEGGVLYLPRDS